MKRALPIISLAAAAAFTAGAAATFCPADLNGDGVVNAADLVGLLGAWGPCPFEVDEPG